MVALELEHMYSNNSGITKLQAALDKSKQSSNQPVVPDARVQTTASQTPVNPNYGGSGVLRLQAVLAKANLARQDNSASPSPSDNSENIYISRDLLGYTTPMDAEEQLKLMDKYNSKNFDKLAAYSGIASLGNAFSKTGGFSTVFGSYTPS